MFSTKVISVKELIIGVALVGTLYKYFPSLRKSFYLMAVRSGFTKHLYPQVETVSARKSNRIKPRRKIAHISEAIGDVVNSLVRAHYIANDKAHYQSVVQTLFRDNMQTLRNLATELKHSAFYAPSSAQQQNHQQAQFHYHRVNTAQVITDILPALKDYARREKKTLNVREFAHGYIDLPVGLLEKILRELLLNAMVHNSQFTEITLRCSFTRSYAVFEIIDSGDGLHSEIVDRALAQQTELCARSRRLSDAEAQFNLRSIAQLLHQLGGAIDIKSALNYGTTIRVILPTLPILPNRFLRKQAPLHLALDSAPTSRKKVLYIGNQLHAQEMFSAHFGAQYAVSVFSSFDQALLSLFALAPDVVIADFSWQHALGIQFCEFLRGSQALSTVPFIMITTAIDQATRVKIYASGASVIVENPFDVNELKIVTNNLINNNRKVDTKVTEHPTSYQADDRVNIDQQAQSKGAKAITTIISAHYRCETFDRFEAAKLLHISEKTLQRRMSKYFSMSFGQFLRKQRLRQARQLLLEGHCITEVTFEMGFNSTSYFGQCFKQEFGYPPSMVKTAGH
jgi:AraC-like DNA-binding protein